jgi:peptidoglycan/LPS O-acetylase OafA/YrhL
MMTRWTRRLAVIAVTLAASVLTFWLLLRLTRPGWQSHEYFAIAFWTLPLCFLVLLSAKVERRWFAQRNALIRSVATIVLILVCSVLWTFLAVELSGGYALAFDANPFYCWTIASLAGMVTAVRWPRTQVKSEHTTPQAAI